MWLINEMTMKLQQPHQVIWSLPQDTQGGGSYLSLLCLTPSPCLHGLMQGTIDSPHPLPPHQNTLNKQLTSWRYLVGRLSGLFLCFLMWHLTYKFVSAVNFVYLVYL